MQSLFSRSAPRLFGLQPSCFGAVYSPISVAQRDYHINKRGHRVRSSKIPRRPSAGNQIFSRKPKISYPEVPLCHKDSPYRSEQKKGKIPDTFLKMNRLRDNPGAFHSRKIVGRGIGSGLGKTCGKGQKGQNSRSGRGTPPGFEGGQTPLYKRARKYGFTNPNRVEYQILNLNQLQFVLDIGKLVQPRNRALTIRDLRNTKVFKGLTKPVKILANGKENFKGPINGPPLNIEVQAISKSAREAIEQAGGKVTTVYFNKLGLFQFLRKPHHKITTLFARPKAKKAHRYDVPIYVLPGRVDPRLKPKKTSKTPVVETSKDQEQAEL